MDNPSHVLNVSFAVSQDWGISLALDTKKIHEVYGEDKTTFIPGEAVYLKLMTASDDPYTLYTSAGVIKRIASDIPYEILEDVSFSFSKKESLQYLPRKGVDWNWIGSNPGSPLFNGKTITINKVSVAILHCEYTTLGDRLRLLVGPNAVEGDEEFDVLVVAVQGDNKASLTVSYSGESLAPQPFDLQVSDYCGEGDESRIEGVEVFLDGSFVGLTDIKGRIYLGELVPGTTHTLKMLKDGYIDSDQDVLHNDLFTVPIP